MFVRAGAIIPEQGLDPIQHGQVPHRLVVNVYGSGSGEFELCEDDGISLLYRRGEYALTPMRYATSSDDRHELVLGPTRGAYSGQVGWRTYEVRLPVAHRPTSISVDMQKSADWAWDPASSMAIIILPSRSIRHRIMITWR